MKKEIAEKWVTALRSDKYEQGAGALRSEDDYCCLGVLCDISGLAQWGVTEIGTPTYLGEGAILPIDVQKWAGITTPKGSLATPIDGYGALTEMNDSGMPFGRIAEIIEKNWAEL